MAARVPEIPRVDELDQAKQAIRAQRIAEMLARWDSESCPDEPDWDVKDILPVRFGSGLMLSKTPDEAP